jgi:hypothetical protein
MPAHLRQLPPGTLHTGAFEGLGPLEAEGMTLATAHFPEPFGEVVRVEAGAGPGYR